jgi:hypothetical protein
MNSSAQALLMQVLTHLPSMLLGLLAGVFLDRPRRAPDAAAPAPPMLH